MKEVIIDDQIPCTNTEIPEPAFSHAHGEELWVILIEKAWAKVHGSYERIEAGFAEEVLRDLTGAPCEVLNHDDENLWDKLQEGEKEGYLMAASAGTTEASKALLEEMGLIGNHSYGILDIKSIETLDGPEQLINLRNPWGDFEWTGDWSDQSSNWTPDLKK
jgi:calpain-15